MALPISETFYCLDQNVGMGQRGSVPVGKCPADFLSVQKFMNAK